MSSISHDSGIGSDHESYGHGLGSEYYDGYPKPYYKSGTGSRGYGIDDELPLTNGNMTWPIPDGSDYITNPNLEMPNSYTERNYFNQTPNLDMPNSYNSDSFILKDMETSLPPLPTHLSTSARPKKSKQVDYDEDRSNGGNTDDAFAIAAASEGSLLWLHDGHKCGITLPSKANKCLRASERINEQIAKVSSLPKPSRKESSSSKSMFKSSSKGGHREHDKKKRR